ncbi:hypothetical protein D9M70_426650 [compost metagenome]
MFKLGFRGAFRLQAIERLLLGGHAEHCHLLIKRGDLLNDCIGAALGSLGGLLGSLL